MKKLIITMIAFMNIAILGQATYFKHLKNNTTPGVTDTVYIQGLNKLYPFINITVQNIGASTCSLAVRGGSYYRNADSWSSSDWSLPILGTIYYDVPIRNSAWELTTTLTVAAGSASTYLVFKPNLDAIKIYITQSSGIDVNVFIEPLKPE